MRRHPAAAGGGGVEREAAPAGSDLDHVIGGSERELLADPFELGHRGLLKRHALTFEQRARVAHRRVEHPSEQLVAEVIVGGDVATAAIAIVAVDGRAQALLGRPQRSGVATDPVDHDRVAGGEADHRDEIRRVPHPGGVGLGEAAAAAHQRLPEPGVVHLDRRRGDPGAEGVATRRAGVGVIDDAQRPDPDLAQQRAGRQPPAGPRARTGGELRGAHRAPVAGAGCGW
jgi:hypothetical protein